MFVLTKLQQTDFAVCNHDHDMPHMRFDNVSLV
jgi:hypothetical protein